MKDPENSDPTQAQLILRRLQETPNEWVPMPELGRVAGCWAVHSRIAELREHGCDIRWKAKGSRPRQSFYMLLVLPEVPNHTTFEFDGASALAASGVGGAL